MKLKIRYDTTYQTLELDAKETEQLWVSLDLDGDGLSQEAREKLIQEAWEESLFPKNAERRNRVSERDRATTDY